MIPAVETRSQPAKSRTCEACGTVISVVSRYLERGANAWEVRVNFGDANRTFMFPTHPGFASGEAVRFDAGRLRRM